MFGIGTTELIIVAVVVLLLFGNRLPSVMRSLGRGVVEFKKGISGIEDELDQVGRKKDDEQIGRNESSAKKEPTETRESESAQR